MISLYRHTHRFRLGFASLAILCLMTGTVAAQNIPDIPSSADIDARAREQERPAPPVSIQKPQAITKPTYSELAQPENAQDITFTLDTIRLEGVTAYTEEELGNIWGGDRGQVISLARLYEIANKITERYRADGYVLAQAHIPAQEIDSGIARINVVEGYVSNVRLENQAHESRILTDGMNIIRNIRPFNIRDLERQMLLLSDLSGTSFRSVLQPDTASSDGGIVVVLVQEKRAPIETALSFDNTGSRYLGPYTANATVSLTPAFLPYHETLLSYSLSVPADELKYYAVSHKIPLTANGMNLSLQAARTKGTPGYTLDDNDIESRTDELGATLSQALIRQRDKSLTLSFGFDYRNSRTDIIGLPLTRDRIRAARLGIAYDMTDSWGGTNLINTELSRGIDVMNASARGDLDLSRIAGRPDFEKISLTAYRVQYIDKDFSLLAGITGQMANGPLLSSEEFGYGGPSFGRAYDSSEILGDEGFAGMMELRHNGWALSGDRVRLRPFAFYDFGKIWNKDPGQLEEASAASAGAGVRLTTAYDLALSLTLAQPLTRPVSDPQPYNNGKNPRLLFSMGLRF